MKITPIHHPLNATVRVPGSKSLTNRALLIAALANGRTRLTNALFSDDSLYFARALQTLGFDVQLDEAHNEMTVAGLGGKIPARKAELYIGDAGTTARFLTASLTLGYGEYILDGDARMRERPIGDLVEALTQLRCNIQPLQKAESGRRICPPLKIVANGLLGGRVTIAGNISSQYLSALLMVAPYAQNPIEIELTTELNSKPYADMTLAVMQDFGVLVQRNGYQSFSIPIANYSIPKQSEADQSPNLHSSNPLILPSQSPISNSPIFNSRSSSSTYPLESDISSASYFFAAPAICGGTVRVENISRKSKQGDIAFLDILQQMGCTVQETDNCILVTGHSELQGVDMDMRDIPDTAQTLAAIAPFVSSPTRIRGIASARLKETDRIHATCTELVRLGVSVEEHEDGMTIYPCKKMRPALIQTYNDHRMAMSFSLIGLRFDGVAIENPSCVSKTFPNFFETLETLR